jgi:AraC-like DNA-binding protein
MRTLNDHQDFAARLLDIEFYTGPSQRVLSRMRCSVSQLIVVVGGIYKATVDTANGRQHIRAASGDIVYWPEGSDHTDESEPGKPLRCISVEFHWPRKPATLPFLVRDFGHLIDLLANRLLALAHDPTRKTMLGAEANVYLATMLAEYTALARTNAEELVARVAHYIEEHIHRPIRLAELARCVGLEENHFGRKYRILTGRTPLQEVRIRKAAYAKHILLLSPQWTLSRVARAVGVSSASKLSVLLTRHAGASARDIKRAARSKPAKRK